MNDGSISMCAFQGLERWWQLVVVSDADASHDAWWKPAPGGGVGGAAPEGPGVGTPPAYTIVQYGTINVGGR